MGDAAEYQEWKEEERETELYLHKCRENLEFDEVNADGETTPYCSICGIIFL